MKLSTMDIPGNLNIKSGSPANSKWSFIVLLLMLFWIGQVNADLTISSATQSPQNTVPSDTPVSYQFSVTTDAVPGTANNAMFRVYSNDLDVTSSFSGQGCSLDGALYCGAVTSVSEITLQWTPTMDGSYDLSFVLDCSPDCVGDSYQTTTIVGFTSGNPPIASAGPDLTLTDSDNDGTESVTLDGTASYDPDEDIVTYQWFEGTNLVATGANPTINLSVGVHTLTLTVTDETENTDSDDIVVTINAGVPNSPIADAGPDQTVTDTDGDGLASVTLDGSASYSPNTEIATFEWSRDYVTLASGETPTVELAVGTHYITLYVMDQMERVSSDTVVITVQPAENLATGSPSIKPIAGDNQRLSPNQLSEPLSVRAIGADGQPLTETTITWTITPGDAAILGNSTTTTNVDGETSNTVTPTSSRPGAVFKVTASMPDGTSARFLVNPIAGITGLSTSQRSAAGALDNACPAIQALSRELNAEEQELLAACDYLASASDGEISSALQALLPDQIAAQGRNALSLARNRNKNILFRLNALRAGASGPSYENVGVSIQGKTLPSVLVQQIGDSVRGGAASADESGFGSKLGFFINGNLSFGETETSDNEEGFDFETTGLTTGVDYRYTDQFVLGGALNVLTTESDYENNSGTLDMDGYSLSVYGSYYQSEQLFVDGIFSVGQNQYDSGRNFVVGAVTHELEGDTDSTEYSLSVGGGYEYFWQNLTFTPQARINYTRFEIDRYDESGSGLNLSIDSQDVESLTTSISASLSMAYSTSYGVFIPYFSVELEHEFKDDSRAIVASFVNDPSQSTFSVETDDPDRDFVHLGLGFSAALQGGKSLFLQYENMLGHDDTEQYSVTGGYRQELQ